MSSLQPYMLSALIVLPIVLFFTSRRSRFAGTIVGAAFGAIVSPWAMGLYAFYFISSWGIVPGMVGLILVLIHGVPGFKIAVGMSLIPRGVVDDPHSQVIIELINGLVWAIIYGFAGYLLDRYRNARTVRRNTMGVGTAK